MPVAFAGTVTGVAPEQVTLEVDRWYRAPAGGEVDVVTLTTPAATSSAVFDGVAFSSGDRFLVTATDGAVNGCGLSGPATAELEASFERAFG